MKFSSKLSLLACAAIFITSPAMADSKDERISALEAQLKIMASELQALKADRVQDKAEINAEINAAVAQAVEPVTGGAKVSFKHGPKIESADGNYSFQPLGRVQVDVTHFDDDASDQPSNTNLRRARLGAKGTLGEDLAYKVEFGFSEDNADIEDAYLSYSGLDIADIVLGHHKPSFAFDENSSANYIMFTERAAPSNAFSQSQRIGVNVLGGGNHWMAAGGLFGESAGNGNPDDDEGFSLDFNASTNVLGLVHPETTNVLHLGAGYSHRRPTGTIDFDARPTGDSPNIIDTGDISGVDSVDVFGAELAGVFGPFSFQSEYFLADVDRGSAVNAEFDGYYAQAGWFITGESRPYKGKSGKFSRVKPINPFSLKNGGAGAWEVLARYEHVDLNDADAGILGGELENTTIGVNWHLDNHTRLLFNYILVDTDDNAVVADDDPSILNMRFQWDF